VKIVKAKPRIKKPLRKRNPARCSVEIIFLKKQKYVSALELKNLIKYVLNKEGIFKATVALILTSDLFLKSLNKKFHSRNALTDVLAFELKSPFKKKRYLFGDIFVSVDAALFVSQQLNVSFKEELYRYVVHGILHLVGYDDSTDILRRRMWKRQELLLKKIISQATGNRYQVTEK
jgi:rRNA maturation RNase YbeY